jgi:hypothetical protein
MKLGLSKIQNIEINRVPMLFIYDQVNLHTKIIAFVLEVHG